MTTKQLTTLARIINEIRQISNNAPTQDGRDQSRAACDCIAYAIRAEIIKTQEEKDAFLKACNLLAISR